MVITVSAIPKMINKIPTPIVSTSHCFAVRLASLAQDDTGGGYVYVSS